MLLRLARAAQWSMNLGTKKERQCHCQFGDKWQRENTKHRDLAKKFN
jgi:hypothetical protein